MMELEEELNLRIKDVFDNFDDGESNRGWSLLQQKYKRPSSRKHLLYLLSGIAASLALLMFLWFFDQPGAGSENETKNVETNKTGLFKEGTSISKKVDAPSAENAMKIPKNSVSAPFEKGTKNQAFHWPKLTTLPKTQAFKSAILATIEGAEEKDQFVIVANQKSSDLAHVKNQIKIGLPENTGIQPILSKIAYGKQHQIAIGDQQDSASISGQSVNAKHNDGVNNADQPKKSNDLIKAPTKIANKVMRQDRKNSYEIYTGTLFTYNDNNKAKFTASVGLSANFKVSSNLFLTVGAGVSKNNLTYDSYNQAQASDGLFASPTVTTLTSKTNIIAAQPPVLTNTKLTAQLLNLDLPISIKLYPTKNHQFYLLGGVNSNSYLSQKYNYTYTYTSPYSFNALSNSTKEENEKSTFKGFDFANSAIFAIGISKTLGKSHTIIFEPYFRPAIGNIGEKNLKFNTAGLNLKFNFTKATKEREQK